MKIKSYLIGRPLANQEMGHVLVGVVFGLGLLSPDAISSNAYSLEEIMLELQHAGPAFYWLIIPIVLTIIALLSILVLSYRGVIRAYPNGGGAYVVSKDNLGINFGLVAGASLLIDYILTVAVSTSAGVAALASAFPQIRPYTIEFCAAAILLIALVNLRGVNESAKIFVVPTVLFVILELIVICTVLFKYYILGDITIAQHAVTVATSAPSQGFSLFLLLKAFSGGVTALTGVEAISNAVPIFKEPQARNAQRTLGLLAIIISVLLLGNAYVVLLMNLTPQPGQTLLSLVGQAAFGKSFMYFVLQFSTAIILLVAANTSFTGFPQLASLLAKDTYLPRYLAMKGDRLAYSNGILLLTFLSVVLVVIFRGDTHALIPLYAIGVVLSFTMCLVGMIIKTKRSGAKDWWKHSLIYMVGATLTSMVTIVFAITKFAHGAWVVVVIIPLFIYLLKSIHRHYESVGKELRVTHNEPWRGGQHIVVVPVSGVSKVALNALRYAMTLTDNNNIYPIFLSTDDEQKAKIIKRWQELEAPVDLIIIESPYRYTVEPLVQAIDDLEDKLQLDNDDYVTVLLPEFVPRKFWERYLHNRTADIIKSALENRTHHKDRNLVDETDPTYLAQHPQVVISTVPKQLHT